MDTSPDAPAGTVAHWYVRFDSGWKLCIAYGATSPVTGSGTPPLSLMHVRVVASWRAAGDEAQAAVEVPLAIWSQGIEQATIWLAAQDHIRGPRELAVPALHAPVLLLGEAADISVVSRSAQRPDHVVVRVQPAEGHAWVDVEVHERVLEDPPTVVCGALRDLDVVRALVTRR